MATDIDLRELAIDRVPREGRSARRRRSVVARLVLPLVIIGGFTATLGWSLRDSLWPGQPVTVVPVIVSRAEFAATNAPLFQAAGWVEPRPQPVVVSAFVEGIVDEVLVVEGQPVEAGHVVARLVRRDAEIAVVRAEADVRLREADLFGARAALTAATAHFDDPIALDAALTEADAALAKLETELARLPALIRGAEAKRELHELEVAGKLQAAGSVPGLVLKRAQSDLESVRAHLDEYRQQVTFGERERVALTRRRDVLQRRLERKVDETRQVAEAKAQVDRSVAHAQQAQADLDAARLKLERMDVRAKSAGRVLSLVAKPGSRLMGIDRAASLDASTVLTMYDPQRLQVRADVRLEDVPRVFANQAVRIETPACPAPMTGHVLMTTSLADIQKNTLQIKLSIDAPPEALKPDMLVQVTFLAPPHAPNSEESAALRLLVPRELIRTMDGQSTIWVADQVTRTARQRSVTAGAVTADGLLEIISGLNVGDRLIVGGREMLSDGKRIRITGLDASLGREPGMAASHTSPTLKSSQINRSGGPDHLSRGKE